MIPADDGSGTSTSRVHGKRHRRPLVNAAAAFICGILLARYLHLNTIVPAMGGLLLACSWVVFRRKLGAAAQFVLILALVAAAGAALAARETAMLDARSPESIEKLFGANSTLCWVRGTVRGEVEVVQAEPLVGFAELKPQISHSFRLTVAEIESNNRTFQASGSARVNVRGEPGAVGHGDRVRVFGWAERLDPNDPFHRHLVSSGLAAQVSVGDSTAIQVEQFAPYSVLRLLYELKQSFRKAVDAHFPSDGQADTRAILKALLLGDREQLGRGLREAFEKSGTMHLLVVSGLHVGIVYGAVIWLCRILLIPKSWRWPAVMAVVASYAIAMGLGAATVRAALMIVLFELSILLKFRRDPVNAVAATALVLLTWRPSCLFDVGFQLTFVGVLGILLFFGAFRRLLFRWPSEIERLQDPALQQRRLRLLRRAWRIIGGGIGTAAAASLAVAPLQAHYFSIITPVSVIGTALLIPVIGMVILFGLVFLAAAMVLPARLVPGLILAVPVEVLKVVVGAAAELPFGHAYVAPPAAGWVLAFYAGLLVVAARGRLGLSAARAVAVPGAILCAYLGWRALLAPGPELAVTFLDVGHGAAVVVTRGRSTMVYDCGSGTPLSTVDVGRGRVARRLWDMGVQRIDLLLLSHTDADHVNGVLSLIDRFPAGMVAINIGFRKHETGAWLEREFRRRGIRPVEAGAGDRLRLGGIEIDVLWPPKQDGGWQLGTGNARSLVASVRADGRSILLTGDIEQAAMGGLMATQPNLVAEVLYVPHHGKEHPVLADFVRTVAPRYAVISDRADRIAPERRWHPSEPVETYRTSSHGDISFHATAEGWAVRTQRRP